ncbi:conserved hypothetical protein [Ricinus communis]|uniref:Uncharacterized protein n=1 Tax=Ricinus communis TaxID=3988 RepID=B9S3R3_RICCO|nr:conserved hypothetical protein [Ricinus communis]
MAWMMLTLAQKMKSTLKLGKTQGGPNCMKWSYIMMIKRPLVHGQVLLRRKGSKTKSTVEKTNEKPTIEVKKGVAKDSFLTVEMRRRRVAMTLIISHQMNIFRHQFLVMKGT